MPYRWHERLDESADQTNPYDDLLCFDKTKKEYLERTRDVDHTARYAGACYPDVVDGW